MTGTNIQASLMKQTPLNRVAMALGFKNAESDSDGVREAKKYMSSVITVVQNADPKTKLQLCSPESILNCCIDAAKMKVAIDGRKHACLIAYGGKATLQVTSAGYEAKLYEHLDRCSVITGKVFKGDEFVRWSEDNFDHFTHKISDPFNEDQDKIKGIFVAISWFENDIRYQKVEILTRAELMKIMNCAKHKYVWDKWWIERATTAAIKRASKRFFNKANGLQELVQYDNEKNNSIDMVPRSDNNLVDNINKQIASDVEAPTEVAEVTEEVEEDIEAVLVNEPHEDAPEDKTKAVKEVEEMDNISEAVVEEDDEEDDDTGGGLFPKS